ncbi:hypothetical protein [Burkholderia sp. AU45388]|uniref:hypothetical protein n=1 Tax=Burkholderia sp. AU45388 TaxID=3059206 RepID=UPI0026569F25|nr:hypothetical protein [Burkholderia sp. AU45388]MDN7430876.1 hypothetical protein [Burkholderia sp. AU45388]
MNCPAPRCAAPVSPPVAAPAALSTGMTLFFAATVGVIVMDLFAAQPLTGPISADLHLPAGLAGLVAMLPPLGYAAGLVLLVPLVDLLEHRRLIVATLAVCAAAQRLAHGTILMALVVLGVAGAGGFGFDAHAHRGVALALLAGGAALLDAGVIVDQTIGRRAINLLNPAARGRLNGLFVGLFFVGGALGAALAGSAWAWGGWSAVCGVGFAFAGAAAVFGLAAGRGGGAAALDRPRA